MIRGRGGDEEEWRREGGGAMKRSGGGVMDRSGGGKGEGQ